VVAGTRAPVDTLFQHLEAGKSLDDFLEPFPTVPREKAVGILQRANARVAAKAAADLPSAIEKASPGTVVRVG
jgi:uncharacterized protein (DUF433 family)